MHLLALSLSLEVLESSESEGTTDEDDGVEADAGGGAVVRGDVLRGLGVGLGLGVTGLFIDALADIPQSEKNDGGPVPASYGNMHPIPNHLKSIHRRMN